MTGSVDSGDEGRTSKPVMKLKKKVSFRSARWKTHAHRKKTQIQYRKDTALLLYRTFMPQVELTKQYYSLSTVHTSTVYSLRLGIQKVILATTFYIDLKSMKVQQLWILTLHVQLKWGNRVSSGNIPVKVSVHGLIPASLFEVPKSEIFNTPLYVLISTLSPWGTEHSEQLFFSADSSSKSSCIACFYNALFSN